MVLMKNVVSRFERLINRVNIVYGLIIPVALFTMVAMLQWVFTPEYFQPGSLTAYLAIISSVAFVFAIHFLLADHMQRGTMRVLYIFYHVALICFCTFVAPFVSPYEFLWVVLAIGMDLLFGRRWVLITFTSYAVVLVAVFMRTNQEPTLAIAFIVLAKIVGLFSVTLLVSQYRKISDQERVALKSTTSQNAFERQRLLSLINNMGDAVLATDENGKVLLYNAAVLDLLDTNETLEGKQLGKIVNLQDKTGKKIDIFHKLRESNNAYTSSDYRHVFSKDDYINVYINGSPIKLGFKERTQSGFIVIMRDITKEKSLEEERDEFISVVSHELRTPITIAEGNISNAIALGQKKDNKKVLEDALSQAHEQVVFLANMINDLSTLSRAERTDKQLEISEVNPENLLHALHEDYKTEATSKGLKFVVTTAAGTKPIKTSELYLHEVLQNFITNALKYTKKGSIIVHARSDKDGSAIFSVSDTGIGLSKADQKHIFEKFFRSEDFRTRESSGTGLGLYVTHKLAHKLGGNISFESELNKGTTFTLVVPSIRGSRARTT